MPRRYDDWGNPILPPPKPGDGLRNVLNLFRRNQNRIIFCLAAIGLWHFWPSWPTSEPRVDWKQFAYVQYATDTTNLCNSFMVFEALHRLGSKADRVLLYPDDWDFNLYNQSDLNSQLLVGAQQRWNVKLKPVLLLDDRGVAEPGTLDDPSSWDTSITKLRIFQQDEYERVIHLDSDITLYQHLDELFLLPSSPIAMPRAYQANKPPDQWSLSSQLMLLEPNPLEFDNLFNILLSWRSDPDYEPHRNLDMDLINHRFAGSAMVLPHRPYVLPSSEFRLKDHSAYLGTRNGPEQKTSRTIWNPQTVRKEAKLVHFNDDPLPKPWVMWPADGLNEIQPDCGGLSTCAERDIWKDLYEDFRERRQHLCRILSVEAPNWADLKNGTYGSRMGWSRTSGNEFMPILDKI